MNFIARFLSLSRKQWPWMAAGIILGVLVIAANSLLMAVSGWFIASMAVAGQSGVAFNYFFPSAGIRFLAIARTVGRYSERLVTHSATFRILAGLRVWLFRRLEPLAPAGLERSAGGDVAGRLRADVDALETLYLKILAPLAVGSVSIGAGLLFLLCFSPPSALVMLLFLFLAGAGLPLLIRRFSEKPGRKSAALAAALRNKVTEGLQGIEELILLGAVERQAALVDGLSEAVIAQQERLGRINGLATGGMAFFAGCGVAAPNQENTTIAGQAETTVAPTTVAASTTKGDEIIIAWYPNESGEELSEAREQIGAIIEKATGMKVKHQTTTDYLIAIEALAAGTAHIAFTGGEGYVQAHDKNPSVLPLVTNSGASGTLDDAKYYSWLNVAKGSETQYMKDGKYSIDNIVGKKFPSSPTAPPLVQSAFR